MKKHTCSYCDGTLQSTRPLCLNCGHPLCKEIDERFTTGKKVYKIGETVCPKCSGTNIIVDNVIVSVSYTRDEEIYETR